MNTQTQKQIQGLSDLPTSPEKLLSILDDLGITYERYHHAPVFTVEESAKLDMDIPGTHCRNLYLRDKKKRNFLVVAANETELDLKKLSDVLDCGRLSFGSGERLWQYLGIRQGSVNPFCAMNDKDNDVTIILDQTMMEAKIVNYHPMDNAQTIGLSPQDLARFLDWTGSSYKIVDLSAAAPDQ